VAAGNRIRRAAAEAAVPVSLQACGLVLAGHRTRSRPAVSLGTLIRVCPASLLVSGAAGRRTILTKVCPVSPLVSGVARRLRTLIRGFLAAAAAASRRTRSTCRMAEL
jgi:hypothetical protein